MDSEAVCVLLGSGLALWYFSCVAVWLEGVGEDGGDEQYRYQIITISNAHITATGIST